MGSIFEPNLLDCIQCFAVVYRKLSRPIAKIVLIYFKVFFHLKNLCQQSLKIFGTLSGIWPDIRYTVCPKRKFPILYSKLLYTSWTHSTAGYLLLANFIPGPSLAEI